MKKTLCGALLGWLALSGPALAGASQIESGTVKNLTRVYDEVRVMPPRPDEAFVRQEFFIGEDDDDTNKDIFVSIIIAKADAVPLMILQITWMEHAKSDDRVSFAKETKTLRCLFEPAGLRLEGARFGDRELGALAHGLLKAVLDKKRLLELLK
jgi:hypothetical protein